MTPDDFRSLALALDGATESAHMGHPDFRCVGRIFASLAYPDEAFAMVKLTPEQQASVMKIAPQVFTPCAGAWGRQGNTNIHLPAATPEIVQPALEAAWQNIAASPKSKQRHRRGNPTD